MAMKVFVKLFIYKKKYILNNFLKIYNLNLRQNLQHQEYIKQIPNKRKIMNVSERFKSLYILKPNWEPLGARKLETEEHGLREREKTWPDCPTKTTGEARANKGKRSLTVMCELDDWNSFVSPWPTNVRRKTS